MKMVDFMIVIILFYILMNSAYCTDWQWNENCMYCTLIKVNCVNMLLLYKFVWFILYLIKNIKYIFIYDQIHHWWKCNQHPHTSHICVIIEMTFLTYAFNFMLHYYYRSFILFFSSTIILPPKWENCVILKIVMA